MPAYRYSRDEVVAKLRELEATDGRVSVDVMSLYLLDAPLTAQDIAWAYQRARQHGWIDPAMPIDPRVAQQLALDT